MSDSCTPTTALSMWNPRTGLTIIISSVRELNGLLTKPILVSDTMISYCIQIFISLQVSWVVLLFLVLPEVFDLFDFATKQLIVQRFLSFRL